MTPSVTTTVTPLVLLVLLAFFFVVALAFTIWAALTVGDAAKRTQQPRLERATAERPPAREPKPWERVPESAAKPRERRQDTAVQGTLWQNRPDAAGNAAGGSRTQQEAGDPGGRVVVKPRKPNTDAFERFLESEKRRD